MMPPRSFIVVGAGPVGLFAALLLSDAGLNGQVLEQRSKPHTHSRAIGIHPPSLHLFRKWGIDQTMINAGIEVKNGFAHIGDESHSLTLSRADNFYNGVIILPQFETETIMRRTLSSYSTTSIRWNTVASRLQRHKVHTTDGTTYNADLVIDARGKASWFSGGMQGQIKPYNDFYIMGDFDHPGNLGFDAHVFLHQNGLVESFPLNAHQRRWVVKTSSPVEAPSSDQISTRVASRTGISLPIQSCTMTSSFIPETGWRNPLYNDVIRIGDAQHIVSPIGGQGMNLGWINTRDIIAHVLEGSVALENTMVRRNYSRYQTVKRRSEFNMMMGQACSSSWHSLRKIATRIILSPPVDLFFARQFTMDGVA